MYPPRLTIQHRIPKACELSLPFPSLSLSSVQSWHQLEMLSLLLHPQPENHKLVDYGLTAEVLALPSLCRLVDSFICCGTTSNA